MKGKKDEPIPRCPVCSSTDKREVKITVRNGPLRMGGRNSITPVADYLICLNCGVHYTDQNKLKDDQQG